jgi:hypothetical protein
MAVERNKQVFTSTCQVLTIIDIYFGKQSHCVNTSHLAGQQLIHGRCPDHHLGTRNPRDQGSKAISLLGVSDNCESYHV